MINKNYFIFVLSRLLRYIKAAQTVFTKAESVYLQGDEEQAYIYFIKYFHVYTQLRSTHEYINKSKVLSVRLIGYIYNQNQWHKSSFYIEGDKWSNFATNKKIPQIWKYYF